MSAGGEMGGRGVDVFWRRCLTRQGTGCGVEGPRTAHHGRSFPYREFRSEIGCSQLALSHSAIHTPAGCCGSIQSSFTPLGHPQIFMELGGTDPCHLRNNYLQPASATLRQTLVDPQYPLQPSASLAFPALWPIGTPKAKHSVRIP